MEVRLLWRGAKYMVVNGVCRHVDSAVKSTSRPGACFVREATRKFYFTAEKLP